MSSATLSGILARRCRHAESLSLFSKTTQCRSVILDPQQQKNHGCSMISGRASPCDLTRTKTCFSKVFRRPLPCFRTQCRRRHPHEKTLPQPSAVIVLYYGRSSRSASRLNLRHLPFISFVAKALEMRTTGTCTTCG